MCVTSKEWKLLFKSWTVTNAAYLILIWKLNSIRNISKQLYSIRIGHEIVILSIFSLRPHFFSFSCCLIYLKTALHTLLATVIWHLIPLSSFPLFLVSTSRYIEFHLVRCCLVRFAQFFFIYSSWILFGSYDTFILFFTCLPINISHIYICSFFFFLELIDNNGH